MTTDMLSSSWKQNFNSLLLVELHSIDEKNTAAIGGIMRRAAANGSFRSGNTLTQIASELAASIQERASSAIQIIHRIVENYNLPLADSEKSDIIKLLQNMVADQQAQLRQKALATGAFQQGPQGAQAAALRCIDQKAEIEIKRIVGEIDLMAARKQAKPPLDRTAYQILAMLKEDFVSSGRASSQLADGYVGPSLPAIQEAIMADGEVSQVDFDLSLSALEKNRLVRTGPMELYDNPPGSSVIIFSMISKREYLDLTEEGYRAANKPEAKVPVPVRGPVINISGSQFHNSPVGAGTTITQTVSFDVTNENETVNYLWELLSRNNGNVDASAKQEIKEMVEAANAGDMKAAKPIFQRLFGGAASAVKELATGVLTAIVNKQLGLDS